MEYPGSSFLRFTCQRCNMTAWGCAFEPGHLDIQLTNLEDNGHLATVEPISPQELAEEPNPVRRILQIGVTLEKRIWTTKCSGKTAK